MTIEVAYGQTHGLVSDGEHIGLKPPMTDVTCSYLTWNVASHDGWSLRSAEGSLPVHVEAQARVTGLTDSLKAIGLSWAAGFGRLPNATWPWVLATVAALASCWAFCGHLRWLPTILQLTPPCCLAWGLALKSRKPTAWEIICPYQLLKLKRWRPVP